MLEDTGPDLLDLLNEHNGCLPEFMAAFFFCQLLQAAQYMHDKGYTHRDIKPENCMVQRSNHQLKLIDFGLSKHLESAKTLGVGTPDYLSPEMLQAYTGGTGGGASGYDARAVDAWAMGVLMYLLTTGKYPFEDPRHPNVLSQTIQNVLHGRMQPFPSSMSPGCRALIMGLLQCNPKQRTTLQDLAKSEWLLSQAQAYGNQVGRVDLLEPLISLSETIKQDAAKQAAAKESGKEGGASTTDSHVCATAGPVTGAQGDEATQAELCVESGDHAVGGGLKRHPRSTLSKVCSFFKRHIPANPRLP
ncbi:kinase-like domain-containing protein [Dunaliella salina]|uniref:Kinase-like domain-containing protein n=1 Tax=Dunaliella salina TaxID=3046 RepID=A0ABQ7G5N7_DUNSA|nr:kinase-like domain-containing protein [Dunaliella salina]|eukprot:KAF5829869.1 kinase-like domain-containing protein [Dunaliella salina]